MPEIALLSNETIDKIAAGEVVEKPLNVVKELVENSIDAGSTNISVEIKNGGIELIRVTDNGCGIPKNQISKAFLRHATSKLRTISDLEELSSLGFRGEALSSISAVSKTEMITKTEDELLGSLFKVEGGVFADSAEIGAPNGTTIVIRQLFFNTPARRKFLKSPVAEALAIEDMVEKFALSHPEISFQFINNGKTKISTPKNGSLKDVIYHIFGKNVYDNLLRVSYEVNGISITGFTGRPELNYQARNGELYFVNGRFVKSNDIKTAIEEVYRNYLMQHQFPFCVLNIEVSPDTVDVNVHPQKLEVRFSDSKLIKDTVIEALKDAFLDKELIPSVSISNTLDANKNSDFDYVAKESAFDNNSFEPSDKYDDSDEMASEEKNVNSVSILASKFEEISFQDNIPNDVITPKSNIRVPEPFETKRFTDTLFEKAPKAKYEQESLFEKKLINDEPIKKYRIIGQVFDTYWLISLDDDLYIVDQHAAHEKVNYEKFVKMYESIEVSPGQMLLPPIVIHLSPKEEAVLLNYEEVFTKIGYEFQEFGQGSYAIRSVPLNLYGSTEEEMFHRLLNELMEKDGVYAPSVVMEKLASMSCKAAIKGNQRISFTEMENLMMQLMSLDNPYNCPHGRPVFIKITKYELEKKFKRIV